MDFISPPISVPSVTLWPFHLRLSVVHLCLICGKNTFSPLSPLAPWRSFSRRLRHCRRRADGVLDVIGRVAASESIRQEIGQIDLLLSNETLRGEVAFHMQIEHRADAGCGGDLDGAAAFAHEFAMIDLSGVGHLREISVL